MKNEMSTDPRRVAVAPMMGYTDRHARYFYRLIAPGVLLYTEMVTCAALLHGDPHRLLAHDALEYPLALQLGGADPRQLAECAIMGEEQGYTEINLNVGCPSPRVSAGRFGACLMQEPALVADCVAAMRAVVKVPVTVKCRTGVDAQDSEDFLHHFVETVQAAGCSVFIVHARKAFLKGLSPRENRNVPPLCYERVYQLKKAFPQLTVVINGGIQTVEQIQTHLRQVEGVMLGRAICATPWLLHEIQRHIFSADISDVDRESILRVWCEHVRAQLAKGMRLSFFTRPLTGLFQGEPFSRRWRRCLAEQAHREGAGAEVIQKALADRAAGFL